MMMLPIIRPVYCKQYTATQNAAINCETILTEFNTTHQMGADLIVQLKGSSQQYGWTTTNTFRTGASMGSNCFPYLVIEATNSLEGYGGSGGGGNGGAGGAGLTACLAGTAMAIDNQGTIAGGGGGGGGGALGKGNDTAHSGAGCYSLNGGAGGTGAGYPRSAAGGAAGQSGDGGTAGTGGTGSALGSSGNAGGSSSNACAGGGSPGAGGAAGDYISGNSNVTWVATGTQSGGSS